MGKHWARQQVKTNELQLALDRAAAWTIANRQTAQIAAAAALAVALAGGIGFYRHYSARKAAWEGLAQAQALAYGGRWEDAANRLKAVSDLYPGSEAAAYGRLFAADMLYPRGQYKEAVAAYAELIARGEPKALIPLALGGTALAQEADGLREEASKTAQRFLEEYPDHFLAPQVHACLSRCLQASGQTEPARSALQKIVLQYPDTAWASWAQARLTPAAPLTK